MREVNMREMHPLFPAPIHVCQGDRRFVAVDFDADTMVIVPGSHAMLFDTL